MNRRIVLTELSVDDDAIRSQDKSGILFDMGLGAIGYGCGHVDFYILTSDSSLITQLRENMFPVSAGAD